MIYYIFLTIVVFIAFLCVRSTYRLYVAKKKLQFWTQVIVFGGILFFVLFVNELIPGANTYYDYKYTKPIVGKAIALDEVFIYESYREPLLGDGYSLYVYGIDDETAKNFRNPSKSFFSDFPLREPYHYKWICKSWTKCPIDTADRLFRKYALSEFEYGSSGPPSQLKKAQKLIHVMLNEKGNYYAYRAFMHGENRVGDITLFVLCPKRKKLIAIYSNT